MVAVLDRIRPVCLTDLLRPLPGIVVLLMDEEPETILTTDRFKIIQRNRKSAKKRTVKGEVVASGKRKLHPRDKGEKEVWGQPPPSVGTSLVFEWGKACMTVYPEDPDFPDLGRYIPEGKKLCFYGRVEPWDTYLLASHEGMSQAPSHLRAGQEGSQRDDP